MKTQCPHCKIKFNTSDENAGKQAKCPKCGNGFTIKLFVETPAITEPAAKTAKPVAPPVEHPKRVESPVKAAQPAKSPESVTPAAEIAEPVKEEKAKSKALSKKVFVYCWAAVRVIAGVLGFLGLILAIKETAYSTLIATFAAADVFLLCSVVIELTLFYKMWAAIQDGQASVSPTKAVAFLFIPIFNLYWALLMFTGFADDYNAFIRRRSVQAKELSFVLFLVYSFLFILSEMVVIVLMVCVFAFIGLISRAFTGFAVLSWAIFFFISSTGLCYFITHILVAMKTCNAISALPE